MSLATVTTAASSGIDTYTVAVEVHLANGLPAFSLVGLPEASVKESKDRVRSAIINSGFDFPRKRITVNLAPADLPKDGSSFDLAIAVGILLASNQIPPNRDFEKLLFTGELALSGALRKVSSAFLHALHAEQSGFVLIAPLCSSAPFHLLAKLELGLANTLLEVASFCAGQTEQLASKLDTPSVKEPIARSFDMGQVKGQELAKRALTIAAAGGHHVLMNGPPGSGKSMLAKRFCSLLPDLNQQQAIEVFAIQALLGMSQANEQWSTPPFRSPHHTASTAALTGGGARALPGELSLAHNGVLFLDEFPEFNRQTLESLREPLETQEVHVSRANHKHSYQARFQLIAAMNPCPCGYAGDAEQPDKCRCSVVQIQRYRNKLSGPLLDRIDLHVPVMRIAVKDIEQNVTDEFCSAAIKQKVEAAQKIQWARQGQLNSNLEGDELARFAVLDDRANALLTQVMSRMHLSMRSYHRILKVARSIADLEASEHICFQHLAEAIQLRDLKAE